MAALPYARGTSETVARLGFVGAVRFVLGRQRLDCFDLTLRDLLLSPVASLAAGLHRSVAIFLRQISGK